LGGRTGFTRQRPRPRCSASKPDSRAEVDVGRGGGSRQLRRGRASLVVGVRAAAASIAARLIHPLSRRAGAPGGARPTGPEASGTHWLHAGPVGRGGQRAPAVTTSDRGTAGQVAGEAATRPLLRRRARDRVSQACGHDSGWFFFVRSAPRPGPRRPPLVAPARPVPPPVLGVSQQMRAARAPMAPRQPRSARRRRAVAAAKSAIYWGQHRLKAQAKHCAGALACWRSSLPTDRARDRMSSVKPLRSAGTWRVGQERQRVSAVGDDGQ
jgi:hypothetical protein